MTTGPGEATRAEAIRLLRLVAARGLPGADPPSSPVGDEAAERLVWAAVSHRLTGTLSAAVDAGDVDLPDGARSLLAERHHQALGWCLTIERRLLEVDAWFQGDRIPFVVVKGAAVAHLDLVDPSERTFSDLDLLVAPEHIDRAVAVLEGHGLHRRWAQVRPGWDRRFAKSITFVDPGGVEVDLHRTLCDGPFGARIPLDRLHAATDGFEVAGRPLRALAPAARVLHAAYHAVVGSPHPSLANVRDIARSLVAGPPMADVVAEARAWRGEAVLAAAVELTRSELCFEAPEWFAWAADLVVSDADAREVAYLRAGDAGLARSRMDLLHELRSPRTKLAYLWGVAFPSRAYLATADRRASDRYLRWLPQVVRRGRTAPDGR